ncbi:regulator of chromosome condensation 1/beta-lactamase-inhibitor protein II [Neurospora hispaniola]|uniref:Regulator of chromosome condensation 1/beta-lactamase-inhibitor protein II n=1 Tax=Neurospora hispaniola TaxID=588809 RepID=A0AAJ0I5Q6_9PEZI|nr:regulator of chromosome condensation 1/beta-lactamase-inhibitor protein II [Neurospora hispaniola]
MKPHGTMELYAAGANHSLQLHFAKQEHIYQGDADDLWEFTCLFRHRDIHTIRSFGSHTIVYQKRNNRFIARAGRVPRDHNALRFVDENIYRTFAKANNEHVAVYNSETATITEYATLSDLLRDLGFHYRQKHELWEDELVKEERDQNRRPSSKEQFACDYEHYHAYHQVIPRPTEISKVAYTGFPDIAQLLAHSTGFAALSSTGEVYTWGDERFVGCLGREVSDECPAQYPSPVPLLSQLPTGPVRHLSISPTSSLLACLTAGNDLYIWGDPRQLPPSLQTLFFDERRADDDGHDYNDGPVPVVITDTDGNEVDCIVDVAVGTEHMIALTDQGEVYVIGENWCGQLGLGEEIKWVTKWEKVPLSLDDGGGGTKKEIKAVAAGPWASFLIVGEEEKRM